MRSFLSLYLLSEAFHTLNLIDFLYPLSSFSTFHHIFLLLIIPSPAPFLQASHSFLVLLGRIPLFKYNLLYINLLSFINLYYLSTMNYQPPPPPPQSNEQFDDSYARLNNQYGPVSQDVRNSYPQNDDFAADLNPLLEKKKSKHIRSLIASLILIAGEGAILPLYFTNVIYLELGALIGICVGIYVFYLLLGLCCNPLL